MNDLDAYRAAKLLVDEYGEAEAWSILMVRGIQETEAGQTEMLVITRAVIDALKKLTQLPNDQEPLH